MASMVSTEAWATVSSTKGTALPVIKNIKKSIETRRLKPLSLLYYNSWRDKYWAAMRCMVALENKFVREYIVRCTRRREDHIFDKIYVIF